MASIRIGWRIGMHGNRVYICLVSCLSIMIPYIDFEPSPLFGPVNCSPTCKRLCFLWRIVSISDTAIMMMIELDVSNGFILWYVGRSG